MSQSTPGTPRHDSDGPYEQVSLQAVELLAMAQRAADEAVAEAQSYARDLEESAREQYRLLMQRAHAAAEKVAQESARPVAAGVGSGAGGDAAGAMLASGRVDYVRTYARVAHAQLKAVLGALTDELDRLADLADTDPYAAAPVAAPESGRSAGKDEPSGDDVAHSDVALTGVAVNGGVRWRGPLRDSEPRA